MDRLTVVDNAMAALQDTFTELDQLSSVMKPTEQQRNRISYLLAKQSMLRQGVSERSINMAQLARLKREIGIREEDNIDQLRVKNPAMVSEWRNLLAGGDKGTFRADKEFRALDSLGQAAGTQSITYSEGAAGGYLVPQEYDARLFQSLAQYDEVLDPEHCNVIQTLTGRPTSTPSINDVSGSPATMNKSTILSENNSNTEVPTKAGALSWQEAPKYDTGIVRVSRELFDDAFEPVAAILERVFSQRHALAIGPHVVSGNGSGEPLGFTTVLPAATIVTSASSTLALSDFENVYTELPNVYRKAAHWYMNDATRNLVTKLLESAGRPMIGPAESLLGKPIAICPDMNAAGAGVAAVAVLAHPGYLLQRRCAGSEIKIYKQRYAEYGQYGFRSFCRFDAQPMLFDSAFPPVASLNQHS